MTNQAIDAVYKVAGIVVVVTTSLMVLYWAMLDYAVRSAL